MQQAVVFTQSFSHLTKLLFPQLEALTGHSIRLNGFNESTNGEVVRQNVSEVSALRGQPAPSQSLSGKPADKTLKTHRRPRVWDPTSAFRDAPRAKRTRPSWLTLHLLFTSRASRSQMRAIYRRPPTEAQT